MTVKNLYLICLVFVVISCKETSQKNEDITPSQDSLNTDAAFDKKEASTVPLWMEKIADVDWMEDDKPGHKVRFRKPTVQNGIVTGEFQESYSGVLNICKYEIPSEGVLNMQIIKTIRDGVEEMRSGTFVFNHQLLDNGNALILNHSDGRTLRYTRSENSDPPKEAATENNPNNGNDKLWMDKIAAGDWKNIMNHQIVRFNKPVLHGDIIKGKLEMHEESFTQVFKY